MTSVPPAYQPPGAAPTAPKRKWVKWVVLGCVGVVALIVAVVVLSIGGFLGAVSKATAEPERAVKEFLAAAAAGDYQAAHNYFSSALKQEQPYEQFVNMAQANRHLFQVTHTKFNNRAFGTEAVTLGGELTLQSGSKAPAEFKLVQENNQWKLISYNIGS